MLLKIIKQKYIKNIIISLYLFQGLFVFAASINLYVKNKNLDKFLNFTLWSIDTIAILLIIISLIIMATCIYLVYDFSKTSESKLEKSNLNLRKQRHEFINQLESIRFYIESIRNCIMNNNINDANSKIDDTIEYMEQIGVVMNTQAHINKIENCCLAGVINNFVGKCGSKGVLFEFNSNSSLENFKMLPVHISTVFNNMLINALESCNVGDYISLDIVEERHRFKFVFSNTGEPIDEELNIFEVGISTKGEDRGLGLTNVKEILEKYNGEVYIEEHDPPTFVIKIKKEE